MKTALQELFEYWDTQNNPLVILNWIASNEKRLLEKEKEQIINANRSGIDMLVNKEKFITGEDYYNETYNQNES